MLFDGLSQVGGLVTLEELLDSIKESTVDGRPSWQIEVNGVRFDFEPLEGRKGVVLTFETGSEKKGDWEDVIVSAEVEGQLEVNHG